MKSINVLSLFDGISCGRVALERAGIPIQNYYASEIDKYAIKIAMKNFPDTIQLGDITQVYAKDLPNIDLLIGGSPCQGFSFAGKQLNFDDPRSKLFFEFVRLLKEGKPKYFLMENVRMKKEYQDVISKELSIEPILINSSLVSAQNRRRLYWTNIPNVIQPKDKHIYLKDIIEDGIIDRDKSYCIDANYYKKGNLEQYFKKSRRQLVFSDKAQTILATIHKENPKSMFKRKKFGLLISDGLFVRKLTPIECERCQTLPDNFTKKGSEKISNKNIIKKLRKLKCQNVKLKNVQENHKQILDIVLNITKDGKKPEVLNYLTKNIKKIYNVNIVLELLEKRAVEPEACVINITKIGIDMAIPFLQINKNYYLSQVDTVEELMGEQNTKLVW